MKMEYLNDYFWFDKPTLKQLEKIINKEKP